MTAVLFLVCMTLAGNVGFLTAALLTARKVDRAERHAHRCQAREHRLLAEADASWRGYLAIVLAERDRAEADCAKALTAVRLANELLAIVDVTG